MKRFTSLAKAFVILSLGVPTAHAVVILDDNFDGYADQAAFEVNWTKFGCGAAGTTCSGTNPLGGTLSTDTAASPLQSVLIVSPAAPSPLTSENSQRNQRVFTDTPVLTVGSQLIYSYDFYDITPNTVYRQYANLHDTTAPGSTNQLISMGINNTLTASSDGGDRYMIRILGYAPPAADPDGGPGNSLTAASSWFKMNDTAVPIRTVGWHNLKAILSTDDGLSTDYKFYVDNVLAETVNNVGTAAQIRQYDNIRIGAGVSSTVDAYYDNVHVEFIPAAAGLPGDFNGDSKVDAGDYATWRKGSEPANANNALANDNGLGTPVGTAHYDLWRANFGSPPGAGSGLTGAPVPEPMSICLLLSSVGFLAVDRRRTR